MFCSNKHGTVKGKSGNKEKNSTDTIMELSKNKLVIDFSIFQINNKRYPSIFEQMPKWRHNTVE